MSCRVGCDSAWVGTSPLADVSLAWDNLFQAKDVLQRIENKLDIQERYQSQAQKVRRRLHLERPFLTNVAENDSDKNNSGCGMRASITAAAKRDPGFTKRDLHYMKSEENSLHRKYDGSNLSWAKKESSAENYSARRNVSTDLAMALQKGTDESNSIILRGSFKEPIVSTLHSVYSPSMTPHALRDLDSLSNQVDIGTEMGRSNKLIEDAVRSHSPMSSDNTVFQHGVWKDASTFTLLSPSSLRDSMYAQKLECLRNRSPDSRLEPLKKRIREQRQQQSKTPLGQSEPRPWGTAQSPKKSTMRRKLRKVTFAPPPPVYKGFSAVIVKPSKLPCRGGENGESENRRTITEECCWHKDFKPGAQDSKERRITTKSKNANPAPGSSHSAGRKQRLSTSGSKLYGASAWRKGQKLVRMLLGPPPKCPKLETTAPLHEEKSFGSKSEAVVKMVTATEETVGSVLDKRNTSARKKSCQLAQGDTISVPDKELIGDEPSGTSSSMALKNPQGQEQIRSPRTVLLNAASWGNGLSTQRNEAASSSPPVKGSGKENHEQLRDKKGNACKRHSYSVEEIREYMRKKVAERQKKDQEEKKSVKRAMELKKKRLDEVFKKQKDAFPRKRGHREANPTAAGSNWKSEYNTQDELNRDKKRTLQAWVHLTSLSLLEDENKGSSTLQPKSISHIANMRDSSGQSPTGFSPLKWKHLDCFCSRYPISKHYLLPSSHTQTDLKLRSPKESLKSPQYRNKQERVQAIQVIAKNLGDRIELEAKMLSALQSSRRTHADRDSLHNSFTIGKEEEFDKKLNRMLNINPCFTGPSLQSFPLPADTRKEDDDESDLECERTEAERENMVGVLLSGSTTASEELPWNSESGTLDGFQERKKTKDACPHQSRDSAGIKQVWKADLAQEAEKEGLTATTSCYGLFSRSPQEGTARREDHWKIDATRRAKNTEDIKSPPRTKLYSLKKRNGIGKDTNQKSDNGGENCTYPEMKYRNDLDNVQQKSLDLITRLKIHQLRQEEQLATLRHRAELETQETQKSFDEFLVQKLKWLSDSKGSGRTEPSAVDCLGNLEDRRFPDDTTYLACAPDLTSGHRMKSQNDCFPRRSLQIMRTECNLKDNAASTDKQTSFFLGQDLLPVKNDDIPHSMHSLSPSTELSNSERQTVENSGESSEPMTDSTSRWSDVGQFYRGPLTFSRFTLEMAQQCLRDEELRARHQTALLRLREEALQEKTRAELSWLEHQKTRLDAKRDFQKVADIIRQQQEILGRLQQEQAEISHLHNVYRAAHQERKLLLKQQREIQQLQRFTAHLQQKLHSSEEAPQVFSDQRSVIQKCTKTLRLPDEPSIPLEPKSKTSEVHLQLKQSKRNTGQCTQKDETPVECNLPGEGQRSEVQDMEALKLEAMMPVNLNYDTTGQVSEDLSLGNRGMCGQVNVSLDLLEEAESTVLPDESAEDHSYHVTDACVAEQEQESIKEGKLEESCSGDIHADFLLQQIHKTDPAPTGGPKEDTSASLIEEGFAVLEEMQNEKDLSMAEERLDDVSGCESISEPMLDLNKGSAAKLELRDAPLEELRESLDQTHEEPNVPLAVGQIIQELPTPLQQDTTMVNKEDKKKASGHSEEKSAEGEHQTTSPSSDQTESSVETSVPKLDSSSIALTESNISSHELEYITSDTSLSEFQKVSAVLIDISESSVSLSEAEEANIQDTDISDPEVSDTEETQAEAMRETEPEKEGNQLLASTTSAESLYCKSNDHVASPTFKHNLEDQSNISAHYPIPELHVITLSSRDGQMPLKGELILSKDEKSTGRAAELSSEDLQVYLEDYKENQLTYKRQSDLQERLEPSSSLNISLSYSESVMDVDENLEQIPFTPVDNVEMGCEVCQYKGVYVFKDCITTVNPVTEELKSIVSHQPKNATTNDKVLLSKSLPASIILSVSDNATENEKHSAEGQVFSKSDKITSVQTSNLMNPKDIFNITETCSSDIKDLQTVGKDNEKQSVIEDFTSKKTETAPFLVHSSKDLLSEIKCHQSQHEESVTFISDEVLIPLDEDTLSEILSPVDEVLSYQSADLFSVEKDFSFPREDLPSPPEEIASINSDEMNDNTEDFPSPPEQMMESENENLDPTLDGKFLEEETVFSDKSLANDLPLPPSALISGPTVEDGNTLTWPVDTKNICEEKNDPEGHVKEKDKASSQQMDSSCIPNTDFPSSRHAKTKIFKKQLKPFLTLSEAEVDNDDPMLFFEIGCRVLVKQTQPGTLKYKGYTSFDEGYWVGVALDKPEGDHDGTYEGVKYFECATNCGIFVRPNQISRLLNEVNNSSGSSTDEDRYDEASSPGNCKNGDQQRKGLQEQKSKEKYNKTGNPSTSKENNSRLCMSEQTGKEIKETSQNRDQYVGDEPTCWSFSMHSEPVDNAAERKQMKDDPKELYSEIALSMVEKKSCLERYANNPRSIRSLQETEREELTEEICSKLTRNLLCDTLAAFSETLQKKCKGALDADDLKSARYLGKNQQQKWTLFQEKHDDCLEPSLERLDWAMHDLNTFKSHMKSHLMFTPQKAKHLADKIVAKLIDDAMKEYKKITKRQGEKVENNMLISSGMRHKTLPFLRKLLDAGIFGSSADFGQAGSVQSNEGIVTQRQNLYRLDHWHSAPWKKTEEVAFVVPHNSLYVKKLAAQVVDDLLSGRTGFSRSEGISMPQAYECEEVTEDRWNAESRRVYNQVIFDLTYELLQSQSESSKNSSLQPWLNDMRSTRSSNHILRKQGVNEVKSFIQEEVIKLLNLEMNDLDTKRRLRRVTKFENRRRDRVDLLLIQELQKEEAEWTEYSEDELAVKMKITEDIFDSLVVDTIEVLRKIYLKKIQL